MISSNTVGGLLYNTAQRHPDGPAVIFPDSRQSYAQLQASVDHWARRLLGLGVRPGQHVGLSMTNCPEFIEIVFAIGSIGAVMVPFNPRYRSAELAFVVENSDVSVMVVGRPPADDLDLLGRLLEALPGVASHTGSEPLELAEAPMLRRIVSLATSTSDGVVDLDFLDANIAEISDAELYELYARPRVRDAAMILFTSGTTARPKGAVLSHEAMTRTAIALGIERYRLTPEDKLWDPLPLFHMSGMLPLMASVASGTPFLSSPVDAAEGLRMIREEKATVAFIAFAQAGHGHDQPSRLLAFGRRDPAYRTHRWLPRGAGQGAGRVPHRRPGESLRLHRGRRHVRTSELSDPAEVRQVFSGRPYSGCRSAWSTPRRTNRCQWGSAARSSSVAMHCSTAITRIPRRPRPWSTPRAGSTAGISGSSTPPGASATSRGSRTCSRWAARTLPPSRSRLALQPPRGERRRRRRRAATSDCRSAVAFVELAPNATIAAEELIAYCKGQIASFKVPTAIRFVTEWPMSATKIQKSKLLENLLAETST